MGANFIKGIDTPIAEWLAPLNAAHNSSNTKITVCANKYLLHDPEQSRYHYHFWNSNTSPILKYDIETGSYTNPNINFVNSGANSAVYCQSKGYKSHVISATNNTITAALITDKKFIGKKIKIIAGKGKGQQRIIKSCTTTVHDSGRTTSGASFVGCSNKSWQINQWKNYQVELVGVPNSGGKISVNKILINDSTTLSINNANSVTSLIELQGLFQGSVTVLSNTKFLITSQTAILNEDWDIVPDSSSIFEFDSGVIYLFNCQTSSSTISFGKYDIASDVWYQLPTNGVFGTQTPHMGNLAIADEIYNLHLRSNANVLPSIQLDEIKDGNYTFEIDQFKDKYVFIYTGKNKGIISKITGNTIDTLKLETTLPDSCDETSQYEIIDHVYKYSSISSVDTLNMIDITFSSANFLNNELKNMVVEVIYGTGAGQKSKILSNTNNTVKIQNFKIPIDGTSILSIHNNTDEIYFKSFANINDAITKVINCENFMITDGRPYENGVWNSINVTIHPDQYGFNISSNSFSSNLLTCTTSVNHNFKVGDKVYISGDTGSASAINNSVNGHIITAVTGTTFTINTGASGAAMTSTVNNTTTFKIPNANWIPNQWTDKLFTYCSNVNAYAQGINGYNRILSNTTDTITLSAPLSATQNYSRYSIQPAPNDAFLSLGLPMDTGGYTQTSGSVTTITDTSKNWIVNEHVGKIYRLYHHSLINSSGQSATITSNTSNSFTFSTALTSVANTGYIIVDQYGAINQQGREVERLIYIHPKKKQFTKGIFISNNTADFTRILNISNDKIEYVREDFGLNSLWVNTSQTLNFSFAYDGDDYIYLSNCPSSVVVNIWRYKISTSNWEQFGRTPLPSTVSTSVGWQNIICIVKYNGYKWLIISRLSTSSTERELWRFLLPDN